MAANELEGMEPVASSIEAVCALTRGAEEATPLPEVLELTGRVVHLRRISRILTFLDLKDASELPPPPSAERLTVVCKQHFLGTERMQELRQTVRVGDVVRVTGRVEPTAPDADTVPSLAAARFDLVAKWSAERPGEQFIPQPMGSLYWSRGKREPSSEVCNRFVSCGRCEVVGCRFAHRLPDEGRTAWVKAATARRLERAQLAADPHASESKQSRAARARLFAEFLLATFGAAYLDSGTGVIDVGGGRGDLAFELHTRRGVRTTVIDPRPAQLRREQHAYMRAHPEARLAPHIAEPFDGGFAARGAAHDAPARAHLLERCSALVGMHPDEATGAIAEWAVAHGKPFAVVPCCVFARQFPGRALPGASGGAPVSSYEDLVHWLRALPASAEPSAPRAQLAFLPCGGKNQVVFWSPAASAVAPLVGQGQGAGLDGAWAQCIECDDAPIDGGGGGGGSGSGGSST